jgi:hypothetical protein
LGTSFDREGRLWDEVLEIGQDKLKEEEPLYDCTNEKYVFKDQYIEQTVSA